MFYFRLIVRFFFCIRNKGYFQVFSFLPRSAVSHRSQWHFCIGNREQQQARFPLQTTDDGIQVGDDIIGTEIRFVPEIQGPVLEKVFHISGGSIPFLILQPRFDLFCIFCFQHFIESRFINVFSSDQNDLLRRECFMFYVGRRSFFGVIIRSRIPLSS